MTVAKKTLQATAYRLGAKASFENGRLVGYASVFNVVDVQGELVARGAFAKTLRETLPKGIPVLIKHFLHGGDLESVVAVIKEAKEDSRGLRIVAAFLGDEKSQAARLKIQALMAEGHAAGLSIGYRTLRSHEEISGGKVVNVLDEVALSEVTITLKPANTQARVLAMKTAGEIRAEQRAKDAKDRATRKATITMLEAEISGKTAAEAKDQAADNRAQLRLFYDILAKAEIPKELPQFLRSTNPDHERDGVRVPEVLMERWLPGYARGKKLVGAKTVTTTSEPDIVPETWLPIDRLRPVDSLVDLVRTVPVATPWIFQPVLIGNEDSFFGGLRVQWLGTEDGTQKPESEPVFGVVEDTVREVAGICHASNIVLRRVSGLSTFLDSTFRALLRLELSERIMDGDGVREIVGIRRSAGVQVIPRGAAGGVSADDLIRLKHSIPAELRIPAIYTLHDDVQRAFERVLTADAAMQTGHVFEPRTAILGHRYYAARGAAPLGTEGDVAFGIPDAYLLGVESITVKSSGHYRFRQNQTSIAFFAHVSGSLVWPDQWVLLGDALPTS